VPAPQVPTTLTYLSPRMCVKDQGAERGGIYATQKPRCKSEYTLFGLLGLQSEEERGGVCVVKERWENHRALFEYGASGV
jgi:hypothetical protein